MAIKKRVTRAEQGSQDEAYVPSEIEPRVRQMWEKERLYSTPKASSNKKYILDMFPYPSGASLHVGHVEGYVGTDIISRYERMKGSAVLHPMGWDAFGLPAENYAIKTGIHPDKSTHKNIETFKRQLMSSGMSYDWSHEIDTSDPDFYRWTQWLFILMFKRGLAYKNRSDVNWCPSCETVLANEQVVEGKCDRCETLVIKKKLEQWFLKITDYADRLISGLDVIDWPEEVKVQQKNWIGRSEGALIRFELAGPAADFVEVFTTRADTLFGATFLVISPELAQGWLDVGWKAPEKVEEYVQRSLKLADNDRNKEDREKTGVFTEVYAINPTNQEKIPVWVADFVIGSYGTGAVFADAHDERDFEFAKKYKIALKPTLKTGNEELDKKIKNLEECFTGDGILVDSGDFTGLTSAEARKKITAWLNKKGYAKAQVTYHLRDWLISRQRYWGAPIPMIYCEKCAKDKRGERKDVPGWYTVPERDLPVELPKDVDFRPTGESPIARSKSFQKDVVCPGCSAKAKREVDTMDTYVDSSWYFIRFVDNKNSHEFASRESIKDWLPVDVYVGGGHVVQHLLFARFFWKVLFDAGLIDESLGDEPFLKLRAPGWILGPDSRKMSKRWNNVITPDDIIPKYGADTLRMYEMFMGPFEAMKPWSQEGIEGASRFLHRVWRLVREQNDLILVEEIDARDILRAQHKTVQKITEDIEELRFNTAVAALMEFVNVLQSKVQGDVRRADGKIRCAEWEQALQTLVLLLAPFAPHIAEELYQRYSAGNGKWKMENGKLDSVHFQPWPKFDPELTQEEIIEIPVQVNGKLRGTVQIGRDDADKQEVVETQAREVVEKYLVGVKKVVFVPGRLINFVV